MNTPTELRASAPVFVPRFDTESEVHGRKNENKLKNKQIGRREVHSNEKRTAPRIRNSNRRNSQSKQNIDYDSRARRQTDRDRGRWKDRNTGTTATNQNFESLRSSSSSESKNKGGNRRRKRIHRNRLVRKERPSEEQRSPSADDDTLHHQSYSDQAQNALQAANAFPSLGTVGSKLKTSTVWTLTSSGHTIFQPFDGGSNNSEKEEDDFERRGLQLLPLSRRNRPRSKSNETERNIMHAHFSEEFVAIDFEGESVKERYEDKLSTNQLPCRKPKWNMDRFRDRWWKTLALQRLRRELLEELKLQFVDQSMATEDDSETAGSDSGSYLEPVAMVPEIQPISDESSDPNTLDKMLVQDLGDSFPSPTEAILNAIGMNDETVLKAALHHHERNNHSDEENDYPVHSFVQQALVACVKEDKPHLLRIILRFTSISAYHRRTKKSDTTESQVSPLMIAAGMGHNQCLAILLSEEERHTSSLLSRDKDGNNVMHYCCRGRGDEGSLRILLKELSNGTKWKQQVFSKLLLLRNKDGKTSLHIACENGREDLVGTYLSHCSSSLLSKMLSTTDVSNQTPLLAAVASNSTDVVICLIMWRGNNNPNLWKKASQIPYGNFQQNSGMVEKQKESCSHPCALVWAAKNGMIDMIQLLLQFSSVSGSDYRVTEALAAAIQSKVSDEEKLDCARILIRAGGDPFADSISISSDTPSSTTPIRVASNCGATRILQTLVEVGREALKTQQQLRRRDPKLQQQPESFFRAIEAAENSQMKSALTNALIESLYNGWQHLETSLGAQYLSSAVALYKLGAQFGSSYIERLSKSMQCCSLQMDVRPTDVINSRCFATSYMHHHLEANSKLARVSDVDRTLLSGHSRLMFDFGWMIDQLGRSDCNCTWIARQSTSDTKREKTLNADDEVFLVVRNGEKFLVHASIVSLKSSKLSSAIRFASMNDNVVTTKQIPEVFVDIDGRMLQYMLQHIYHGSVFVGWPSNEDEIFGDLLDLMVVAEEALCPTLVQECEMRLLSSTPTKCYCWSCSKAVRYSVESNRHAAECMYLVEGSGSLITGSRALDVLAIAEFASGFQLEYTIHMASIPHSITQYLSASEAWDKFDSKWKTTPAIQLLKDQATMMILLQFSTVIKSSSFQESVLYNSDKDSSSNLCSHEMLLLQTCLEELPHSSLL